MVAGAVLGALTGLALTAIYYLGQVAAGLPFVPFDTFDQLARVLPGGIITLFIQTMVMLIRGLNLGPTAEVAKLIEQTLAVGMMVVVGALFGVALDRLLVRRRWSGTQIGAVGGVILLVPALAAEIAAGPPSSFGLAGAWIAVTLVGWGVLLGRWVEHTLYPQSGEERAAGERMGRRAFIRRSAAGSFVVTLASFGLGRILESSKVPTGASQPLTAVAGATPPSPPSAGGSGRAIQPVPGTRPEITPTPKFYRIDIDLIPPTVREGSWTLDVAGLFDRPRPLKLSDLRAYPAVTEPRTLSCISNPVGGDLIGTPYWTGLRISDLMKDLGLRAEATGLWVEAADGFYEMVTRADLEDPRTLLVYGLNGETLPQEHGFPLRVLIPNRYGMKQPKWITRFTAIDRQQFGYWVERGWNQEARPQIVSVIDTVAKDQPENGRVPVGGIAWAGDRGIKRVELMIDNNPWTEATLITPPLGPLTWVEWRYDWAATRGDHVLHVRATDGTGALQVADSAPPEPDGATGYQRLTVRI